MYTVTKVL